MSSGVARECHEEQASIKNVMTLCHRRGIPVLKCRPAQLERCLASMLD